MPKHFYVQSYHDKTSSATFPILKITVIAVYALKAYSDIKETIKCTLLHLKEQLNKEA